MAWRLAAVIGCILIAWIAQACPANPVTIDAVADVFVDEGAPDSNSGGDQKIRVGGLGDTAGGAYPAGVKRGFVRFDLPSMPRGISLTAVRFQAYQTDIHAEDGFRVFDVADSWDEMSVTWDSQPPVGALLGVMPVSFGQACTFEDPDLTSLVGRWRDGSQPNHGLSFRVIDEQASGGDTFASRETTFWDPPQLTLEYIQRGQGDADKDGDVDDDDLSLLLAGWGTDVTGEFDGGWGMGEFNEVAPVNDDDLSLLLANWTGSGAVPEPTTLALLAFATTFLLRRRCRSSLVILGASEPPSIRDNGGRQVS